MEKEVKEEVTWSMTSSFKDGSSRMTETVFCKKDALDSEVIKFAQDMIEKRQEYGEYVLLSVIKEIKTKVYYRFNPHNI